MKKKKTRVIADHCVKRTSRSQNFCSMILQGNNENVFCILKNQVSISWSKISDKSVRYEGKCFYPEI